MAEVRATPLPRVGDTTRPVIDRAVARPVGYNVVPQQVNTGALEMDGLLRGLSSINGALGRYTQEEIQKQDELAKKLAADEASRTAALAADNTDLQSLVTGPLPANVPVAYDHIYRDTLTRLSVDRSAAKMRSDMATDYEEQRKKEGFDAEKFIADWRAKALGGLSNPDLVGRMGIKLVDIETSIRAAAEKERLIKLNETENQNLFSHLEENVRADMAPGEVASSFLKFKQVATDLGRSNKEAASMFLGRLSYLSAAKGGDPELFNVFDQIDPVTKKSFLSLNPELAAGVTEARAKAKAMQFQTLEKATNEDNFKSRVGLDKMLRDEPEKITLSLVADYMGDHSVFKDYQSAAEFLNRAQQAAASKKMDTEVMAAFDNGTLGRYPPDVQKKVLEARLGGPITQMWQQAASGDQAASQQLATLIMSAQSSSRSTENVAALERLITSTVSSAPNPNGPDGAFTTAANLYKVLSADPKYRDTYFKDDASTLMRQYNAAVERGSDPKAAYAAAYQSISPEAKATAEKFAKSPEFKDKVEKATKEVVGSSWWPRILGGNGRITNGLMVESSVAEAMKDFVAQNPNGTDAERQEYVGKWVSERFVMDETTGAAVRVPRGLADDQTKAGLTEYSKRLQEKWKFDGDWRVEYRPMGDQGLVNVVLTQGSAQKQIGAITIQEIRQAHLNELNFSEQDRSVMQTLQKQVSTGQLDPTFVEANRDTIAKARKLNGLPADTLAKVEALQLKTVQENLRNVPALSLGQPSMEGLQHVETRGTKVDNKLTASIAARAATSPAFGAPHMGLAASLVTMGEAVVLKAYPDPNPEAGMNIGMGYNLKANAKTARSDLQRAGVPANAVDAVINGQAQITQMQAERLLQISIGRYEKMAIEAAEKTAPGLWSRMTNPQKAVMVDIAWQTGDPDQFKKAWAAAASGDVNAFREQTKVFYTNKSGERVEDKRRGNLRAAMLASGGDGGGSWMAMVNKFGSFPSNAIEATALK